MMKVISSCDLTLPVMISMQRQWNFNLGAYRALNMTFGAKEMIANLIRLHR